MTGLGLVIAKSLVEMMHGEIGVGTVFKFNIHLKPSTSESWVDARKSSKQRLQIAWINQCKERTENARSILSEIGIQLHCSTDFSTIDSVLFDSNMSKVVLDFRLLQLQEGWKQWLSEKIYDQLFLSKVILMGYTEELSDLIVTDKISVIEKPVVCKAVAEAIDPLIADELQNEQQQMEIISLDGTRVLIVDDNKINIQIAAEIIKPTGATILFATNGKDAVDLIYKIQVDIVLMDMEMPIMVGLTATKEIMETHKDLPVIMLTANLGAQYVQNSLDAGAVDCLGKPFDPTHLVRTIKNNT